MPDKMSSRWRTVLVMTVISILVLGAVWLLVNHLARSATVTGGWKIAGIAGAAGVCFLLGAAWLAPALARKKTRNFTVYEVALVAYLLPVLVLVAPLRLAAVMLPGVDISASLAPQDWLRPGAPWLLLIQGCILAIAVFPSGVRYLRAPYTGVASRLSNGKWLLGLFAGLGLWLVCMLVFSLSARQAGQAVLSEPLPQLALFFLAGFISITIIPAGEEFFFRKMLVDQLVGSTVLPPNSSRNLLIWATTAFLFATLQARPMLWLPAFFLGLGLNALAAYTGRLRECILAHAIFNLLTLILNWGLIL
jgi:membrane protease YdiL (CAAX protease family)